MIVKRNGRVYIFNSNRDGYHPLNWKDLVCEALSLQLYVMSNASALCLEAIVHRAYHESNWREGCISCGENLEKLG